jgi:hypothetical protein
MNSDINSKTGLLVVCSACNHEWTASYTPMDPGMLYRLLLRPSCPACGADLLIHGPSPDAPQCLPAFEVRPKMTRGMALIAGERLRQMNLEGYNAAHDDGHTEDELAYAAICYAAPERSRMDIVGPLWPWRKECWKPNDRLRDLVRAGALIAAEVDRLLRLQGGATQ